MTDSGFTPKFDPTETRRQLERTLCAGLELKRGDRVRLRPRPGGDILDLALAGRTATIAAIEQDYDQRIHVAVTVDDDPGRDLGIQGKVGHRFYFGPEEIELLPPPDPTAYPTESSDTPSSSQPSQL